MPEEEESAEGEAEAEAEAEEDEEGDEVEDEGEEAEEEQLKNDDGHSGEQGEVEKNAVVGVFEINEKAFDELILGTVVVDEVQQCWDVFLRAADSREAAGEAIYAALFDSAPSLQSLFKTPRAVMAMRFMNGLNNIIMSLKDPKACKIIVETLGFQHLDLEVTTPRVAIFRNAIVDLLAMELGSRMSKKAKDGWQSVLNWVGGAYIFVRTTYADRLRVLASSWATANKKAQDLYDQANQGEGNSDDKEGEDQDGAEAAVAQGEDQVLAGNANDGKTRAGKTKAKAKAKKGFFGIMGGGNKKDGSDKEGAAGEDGAQRSGERDGDGGNFKNTSVPTTYNEMFMFNAAVMGFAHSTWMNEVLSSFDTIVTNVANSYRLQEECDVLSLRIAKYKGTINLPEYKAVMLASLRSLVPKDWNSAHEVAWSWLWENVERIIKGLMGKPAVQQRALDKLWKSLDETQQALVRREVYSKFFTLAPAGQDYFKQSTTRLHFIADRIVAMTLDMYVDPKKMVEDISALGLRHVGYGIPTDLFGPFVTACVQVIRSLTDDDMAEEAFRWSLSLISRILTRVINEGSTIVMKAINMNSAKQIRKAVACAPRGRRAMWMLNIQVGTQSISPLLWAIETGSLEAARTMILDLLTFRADRDHYYYGMDTMFERHEDIIKRLCTDAPALLPVLLDGLIWRSRLTENGQRRVNYYVKHLVVDSEGGFAKALEWITDSKDPKIVCHPVIVLVTDIVWSRVAFRTFLYGKSWFIFTLLIFLTSQSILHHVTSGTNALSERIAIFCCRCFIYLFSMGQFLYFHIKHTIQDCRAGEVTHVFRVPIPAYLLNWQDKMNLCLTIVLIGMFSTEPILYCLAQGVGATTDTDTLFTEDCTDAGDMKFTYSVFSMIAMLLYYSLVIDLSVLSTWVSAFVLVCSRVLTEVGLFLVALAYFVLTFSSAISALEQDNDDFGGIHKAALSLLEVTLGMYPGTDYSKMHQEPALMVAVACYVIVTVIFLLNLLIAQLNCSYASTFQDMFGFARLNRGKIVIESMPLVAHYRWQQFVSSLRLDERLEFNEGDIGLSGGIQVTEPANANVTTVDLIKRFGGSTSPTMQWPEEDNAGNDAEDRFDKIEKLIEKAFKRANTTKGHKGGSSGMGSSLGQGQGTGTNSDSHEDADEDAHSASDHSGD